MAMTYTEAAQLALNPWFRDRVKVAVSGYTNYLLNADTADPEYAEKQEVATRIAREADMVTHTMLFTLSGDPEIQSVGIGMPDAQLQMIVEKTIKKFYPVEPAAPAGAV